jgi:hypothetical protein
MAESLREQLTRAIKRAGKKYEAELVAEGEALTPNATTGKT